MAGACARGVSAFLRLAGASRDARVAARFAALAAASPDSLAALARVAAARVAHEEGGARRLTMQPLGDDAAAGRQQLSLRKEVARLKAEEARLRAVRTALAAAVALLLVALWVAATIIADGAEAAPRRKGIPLWWQRLRHETTCVLASRPRDWGLV